MDQKLLKQSESLDRQTKKSYMEYIEKAEKAFQKERFGSARYNFSQAHRLSPSELLKEKIRICEENSMRVEKAQELIRQGYLLQKQKKIHEALKYFLQSLEVWEMEHIRALAENLRKKLPRSSINKACQAEADQRYAEAIELYHETYKFLGYSEAKDRLGICLVKQGRYDEAVKVLDVSTSKDPEFRYYMGIALAKLGHYYKALKQWEMIQESPVEFNLQKQHLIEIAPQDLLQRAKKDEEFTHAYNEAMILSEHFPAPGLKDCVAHMRFSHLESLWSQEQFEPMLDFLLSLEDECDSHEYLPVFLAKVYYRLAEQEEEYLPEAISFWLTIIHNSKYLDIPKTKGRKGTSIGNGQLAEDLQKKLEDLIHQYETRDEDLSGEVSIHWETEKQAIMFLKKITQKDRIFAEEICTPSFAERFGKSTMVLERLRALKPLWEKDEDFWITGALFSEAREAFLLLLQGETDEAMAELPSGGIDEFVEYCRQRIFFRLCMEKVQEGESNVKKYLIFALPLIQRFNRYQMEIVQMAQEIGDDLDKLKIMDSLLQSLIRSIQSKELLEIASYIMSYKANAMFCESVITAKNAQRIYKRALELFPDNEFAKDELEGTYTEHHLEEMAKALKKGNLKKATNLTIQSEDEEVEEIYFEFVEASLGQLRATFLDDKEKILYLNDLFRCCEKVDPDHSVLEEILDYIDELGGELPV